MLLYVCLILLPAIALAAVCDKNVLIVFFDLVDANKDGKVDRAEADAIVKAIDINNDARNSLAEERQVVSALEPRLKGQEDALFSFFDTDQNDEINSLDEDAIFRVVDVNNDNSCSRDEFQKYIEKRCGGA